VIKKWTETAENTLRITLRFNFLRAIDETSRRTSFETNFQTQNKHSSFEINSYGTRRKVLMKCSDFRKMHFYFPFPTSPVHDNKPLNVALDK